MTTLITGATGTIGRLIVAGMLERDIEVRALSRNATAARAGLPDAVTVVEGSLASASESASASNSLSASLFEGVESVFLFPASEGVDDFVEAAVGAGVSRFVVLSSLAVSGRNARDGGSATGIHHRDVEQAVTSRVADHTILRPGNFANNLLFWSHSIRSGYPVRMPYANSSQVLIHEADVALAAVRALAEPQAGGRVVELTGPASLTKIEQLAAISDAIGRAVPHVEISADEFRADMARYMPGDIVEMLLRYWSETVDEPEVALPSALGLGRPATPLATWARDHRADFTG
jgi:uncharacterized protein YbjT (DUF2867 family)